jgi:RHS repeat-associated protein
MPIDIASGVFREESEDVLVSGTPDLHWRRHHTSSEPNFRGLLGLGWSTPYEATLTRHARGFELRMPPSAAELIADAEGIVESGGRVRHVGACFEVFLDGPGDAYIVQRWNNDTGEVLRYRFLVGPQGTPMKLAAVLNLQGQALVLEWDAHERLSAVRQDVQSRQLRIHYDADGRVVEIGLVHAGAERTALASYGYDAAGRLREVTDAMGYSDRFEYDAQGRLARSVRRDGGVFHQRYDDRGRCIRRAGLGRYDTKTLRYLDAVRVTEVTDSAGHTRRYEWLRSGQITREWLPSGASTRTEYDADGRITALVDALGATTRFTYDEAGNRNGVVDALGRTTQVRFNDEHQPVALLDARGQLWRQDFDAGHRLVASTNPLGQRWTFEYDANALLTRATRPDGAVKDQVHEQGLLAVLTDWDGNATRLAYDDRGLVTAVSDPLGEVTRYAYDPAGRLMHAVMPDGTRSSATYGPGGEMTSHTDANGHTTRWRFGPCGRLLERIDRIGRSIRFVWSDEPDELDALINEKGEKYIFVRNADGEIVEEQLFDGSRRKMTVDPNGELVGWENAAGDSVVLQRDAVRQVIARHTSTGESCAFSYDEEGELLSVDSGEASVRFDRDAIGRIVREQIGDGHWVCTEYDPMGAARRITSSLGLHLDTLVDGNGAPLRMVLNDKHTITMQRDAMGREVMRHLPGGATLRQQFDVLGQLKRQSIDEATGARWDKATLRDRVGSVVRIDDSHWGTTQWAYDPATQVIQSLRSKGAAEAFAYDLTGNLSASQREGQSIEQVALEHGPGDRVMTRGEDRFSYDASGRRVERQMPDGRRWRYGWDALDRLATLETPDGDLWRYYYDGLGRRVRKTRQKDGHTLNDERFLWDKDVILHEYGPDKAPSTWITDPLGFAPMASIQAGAFYSVVTDHLEAPSHLLDERGAIVWSVQRSTWGATDATTGDRGMPRCPIAFPGQWIDDESGLHYNHLRYYDPSTGAYLSPDPIRLMGGANLYSYSINPVNWSDPYGLVKPCNTNRGKGYVVYHITNKKGKVIYVGITEADRFRVRQQEHRDSGRLSGQRKMTIAAEVKTYGEARGHEQAHIEHYETRNTSTIGNYDYKKNPGNRVNSYDRDRTDSRANAYNNAYDTAMAGLQGGG